MTFPRHALSPAELSSLIASERRGLAFLAYRDGLGDLRLQPLELVGGTWTLADDGLSRNGSFVNGERVVGRRRLSDGDTVRVGRTSIVFRAPSAPADSTAAAGPVVRARLTEGERRVLTALCRPLLVPGGVGAPASNREIAEELHLSLPGVKTHVRSLFAKLGIDELPQYRKRTVLAQRALDAGLVERGDVAPGGPPA